MTEALPPGLAPLRLSVVMPTHNKLALLERTLESLQGQDLRWDEFEVVVVDDGSTDGTSAFLGTVHPPYRMKGVQSPANLGRAAARNQGIAQVTGEVVVFLDDDMELTAGFLRAHRDFHRAHPHAAGVGNVVMHPEVAVAPIDRYMSTRGAQKIRGRGPLPWKYFSTNNASVRVEDLRAVGGFDESFVHYGFEDLELAYRLEKERGVTFDFVEGARSFHIHPHTLDDVLAKKTLCGRSSLRYLFEKHPETREILGYRRFDPPRRGDPWGLNLSRVLHRALLSPAVYPLVKPLASMSLGAVTTRALDYLVQYHYLAGLRGPALGDPREARRP